MVKTESFTFEDIIGLKFGYAPIGAPRLFTHVYYIDGLLIDTGPHRMKQFLKTSTSDLVVDKIFITHYHEDHTGNIKSLREWHNCEAFASPMTCNIMRHPPKLSVIQKIMYNNRKPVDDLISIENSLITKKYNFQLIPAPGHARDMVCLYEPNRKWLFSADLYVNSYIGYFLYDESITAQIESIKYILKLDFDVMFCAHNPQFKNGKKLLSDKLNFLESFYSDVRQLHAKGYNEKEIFKHMELKEYKWIKFLSEGKISRLNMVKAAIRDIHRNH